MNKIALDTELKTRLRNTAPGRAILKSLQLSGNEDILLGKGFWKKAKKAAGKIGKKTGTITGRIAKVAAGLVGIPPSAIDALKRFDPTTSKKLSERLQQSPAGQQAAAMMETAEKINPVYYAAGAAGLIAIVFLMKGKK
jgi:hypothetical protein